MLNGIANGLNKMAEGAVKLDDKVKRMDLVRTVNRIRELENEIRQLREKEACLMAELDVNNIVIVDGKVELA